MNVIARKLLNRLASLAVVLLGIAACCAAQSASAAPSLDYPSLTAIPPAPTDLRSQADWAKAVADLNRAGEAVRREAARPSADSDTAGFASGTRARIDPVVGHPPTAEEQAASLAFSKALRARASAPPRRR